MSAPTPLAQSIYASIKQMEGAAPANNNPGNLIDLPYYQQTGQYRPATYATPAAGDAAALSLIQSYINSGLTLDQFFAKWAPAGHGANDPAAYAAFVAGQTGLPEDVPLSSVGAGGGGGVQYATAGMPEDTGGSDMPLETADASGNGLWLAGAVLLGLGIAMAVGD